MSAIVRHQRVWTSTFGADLINPGWLFGLTANSKNKNLLSHRGTNAEARGTSADTSIGAGCSHPVCSATGCPQDKKRKPPTGHPGERDILRRDTFKERRELTGLGFIPCQLAAIRLPDDEKLLSIPPRERRRQGERAGGQKDWARAGNEIGRPLAAEPRSAHPTGRRNTPRRQSTCRSTHRRSRANRASCAATAFRSRMLPIGVGVPGCRGSPSRRIAAVCCPRPADVLDVPPGVQQLARFRPI